MTDTTCRVTVGMIKVSATDLNYQEQLGDKHLFFRGGDEPHSPLTARPLPYTTIESLWTAALNELSSIDLGQSTGFVMEYGGTLAKDLYRAKTELVEVNAAYKRKDKKVRPVDRADGVGEVLGGHKDWYERSKARDYPQEQIGQFQ